MFSIVLLVIFASIFATRSVFAQSNQVTSTVSLSHLNVQLNYPSQVLPGESANINLTAQAKDSFQLTSLTVQVYLVDQNSLRQLLSATVAQNTIMPSGNQINKQIEVTVPSDAPRTSLVALVTESVSMTSNPYAYAYPYWNAYGGSYPYYYYSNPAYSVGSYPSSYYLSSSDNAIAPLSYVLATTPEYVALQSQYQQLQIQNQQFQVQNQQLQTQNQQLLQQLQASQNSTAQKDRTISNLNNQLSSAGSTTTLAEIVAVILAIAVVAVAALHLKSTRTTETHTPAKSEEKTTGV